MTSEPPDPYGTEWSAQEIELAVLDYFEMLGLVVPRSKKLRVAKRWIVLFLLLTCKFLYTRNYLSIPEGVSVMTVIIDGVDVAPAD